MRLDLAQILVTDIKAAVNNLHTTIYMVSKIQFVLQTVFLVKFLSCLIGLKSGLVHYRFHHVIHTFFVERLAIDSLV